MLKEITGKVMGVYERIPVIGLTTQLIPLDIRKKLGGNVVSGCGLTTMPKLGESFKLGRPGFGNIARKCHSMRTHIKSQGASKGIVYGVDGGNNYTCSEQECPFFRYHNLPAITKRVFPNK